MALAFQPLWPQSLPAIKVYRDPPPRSETPSIHMFASKFQRCKKLPLGCHLVPKVPQSDPKGLQNGALGAPFDYFFLQKADFASDCIFTMFWTHFMGSGLPSFEDISNANVCWL